MNKRHPHLSNREEKQRGGILQLIDEGWETGEWAVHLPKIVHDIQLQYLFEHKNFQIRIDEAADGIQWIRFEEIGKALTDRARVIWMEIKY